MTERKESRMKIDKNKLEAIVALPDDELWRLILDIAKSKGITLPERPPRHEELEKIRAAISHGASPNIAEALRVIKDYKRGCKNG